MRMELALDYDEMAGELGSTRDAVRMVAAGRGAVGRGDERWRALISNETILTWSVRSRTCSMPMRPTGRSRLGCSLAPAATRSAARRRRCCRRLSPAAGSGDECAAGAAVRWGGLEVREQVASGASARLPRLRSGAGHRRCVETAPRAPHSPTGRDSWRRRITSRACASAMSSACTAPRSRCRAGLWCEWVDGRPLTQMCTTRRVCAAEAAYVGIELALRSPLCTLPASCMAT